MKYFTLLLSILLASAFISYKAGWLDFLSPEAETEEISASPEPIEFEDTVHIETIPEKEEREAKERFMMSSSKLIIMTEAPKSGMSPFFEKLIAPGSVFAPVDTIDWGDWGK